MRRIIKNKVYDTDTAKEKATYFSSYPRASFQYYEETLYIKKNGEFFLYGKGNGASPYAESRYNSRTSGEKIIPLTYDKAKEWAEKRLTSQEYLNIFEVDEDSDCSEILKEIRRPTGLNMNDFSIKYEIPVSTYSKWEQGQSSPPEYVIKLLKFKVDYDLADSKK